MVLPQFVTQKHHSGHPLVHKPALGLTLTQCSVPSNQAYSLLLRDMSLLSRVWVAADRMCMMSRLSRGMALSSGSYRKDGRTEKAYLKGMLSRLLTFHMCLYLTIHSQKMALKRLAVPVRPPKQLIKVCLLGSQLLRPDALHPEELRS